MLPELRVHCDHAKQAIRLAEYAAERYDVGEALGQLSLVYSELGTVADLLEELAERQQLDLARIRDLMAGERVPA